MDDRQLIADGRRSKYNLTRDLADRLEAALNRATTLRDAVNYLLSEVDCRIEHGAESGGHLEYVRDRLTALAAAPAEPATETKP